MIYLDHCATTPLDDRVRRAMEAAASPDLGNPSSVHGPGRRGRALLAELRARVARALAASPDEIVFTGSGSEAANLAIVGAALAAAPGPFRLVVSAIEHECVLNAARYLAARFPWVSSIEVKPTADGSIDPAAIDRACESGADLVSVMTVNNETGAIQPIAEIARVARSRGALVHTDAVQAVGRVDLDPRQMGVDLLSISAHKFHGPRGVGALYVRKGVRLDPIVHGGHQERERRAGTENVAGIAGLTEALDLALAAAPAERARLAELEDVFLKTLTSADVTFQVNGPKADKASGVVNLSLQGVRSHDMVIGMDISGYAISAGSACSAGVIEASPVLIAMGLDRDRASAGVRVSFGRGNTIEDARGAARAMARLQADLRSASIPTAAEAG